MIQKIKLGSFFTILLLVGSLIISGVTGASSVNNFQFSIFVPLGTPDANRNIVTNFSNIQPLTIYENNFLITIYQPVYD